MAHRLLAFSLICLFPALLSAQQAAKPAATKPAAPAAAKAAAPGESFSETRHSITLGGAKLDYVATAGNLVVKDDDDKAQASIFFVAYTKTGAATATRPVTFAFNGGPGSSSVWLHMGALGPRRVTVGDVGEPVAPPYHLEDNETTLLDLTDLVFIDPVTTGYSRPAAGQNAKQFHGVQEDVQSVGDFIRLYVTRFGRWDSPKFLAGESYGTTRAAGLAGYLQDRHGMDLNGILLISCVLNFATIRFDEGNDLPYALYLPTYAATAWYHKRLPADLQGDLSKTLAEVRAYAQNEYTVALTKGDKLPASERQQVAHAVARYTGLSEAYVLRSDLRIEISRFCKELLRDKGLTVGRFDSRFTGSDRDTAGERPDYDPSYSAVLGPYTATFNAYVRKDLKYEKDIPYEILTGRVQPWNYGNARNRYLNVAPTLRQAMAANRGLRVFVANGHYDLATPFLASEYTFDHLGPEGSLASRVTLAYYEAGHMMYTHAPSRHKLKKDIAAFFHEALRR